MASKFKNFKKTIAEEFDNDNNGIENVGQSLISQSTKETLKNTYDDIFFIEIDKLVTSELNTGISMEEIEELAESIELSQLFNPINVVQTSSFGIFKIIAGHRRTEAFKMLYKKTGDDKYKSIPAFIIDVKNFNMPLSNELKIKYAHSTTNVEKRQDNEQDIATYVSNLSEVYDALKEKDDNLGKKRDYIGERLKMSGRQVQKYINIESRLDEDLKEKFYVGELDVDVADELTRKPKEEQKKIYKENSNNDVKILNDIVKKGKSEQQDYFHDSKKAMRKLRFNSFELDDIEDNLREELIKKKNELNKLISDIEAILEK